MNDSGSNFQLPHLPRPGRQEDEMPKEKPDFPVRLGTSLARSSTELQIRMLGVRPIQDERTLDRIEALHNFGRRSGTSSPTASDRSKSSVNGVFLSTSKWLDKRIPKSISPTDLLSPYMNLTTTGGRMTSTDKNRPRTASGRKHKSYNSPPESRPLSSEKKEHAVLRRNSDFALPRRNSDATLFGLLNTLDSSSKMSNVKNSKRKRFFPRQPSQDIVIYTSDCDKEHPLARFRRISTVVRRITAICIALKRYATKGPEQKMSFQEMYLHLQSSLDDVLAFNPNSFGKVEPAKERLKDLLSIQKKNRTAGNVKSILSLLHGNAAFQDYPPDVRSALAKCMTYHCYESRRVVLKKGHRAESFYIILSGTLIVNLVEKDRLTGQSFERTAHEMGPGETFGEIALLEGGTRTATIICKTPVELLVVPKEDFDIIIKEPLLKQRNEHVTFCKNLALFQDFPCEKFISSPTHFFYHYFRPGSVVVQNGEDSKYIIIVKAGKCKIVCKFVESRRPLSREQLSLNRELEDLFPEVDCSTDKFSFGTSWLQYSPKNKEQSKGNDVPDHSVKCNDRDPPELATTRQVDGNTISHAKQSEISVPEKYVYVPHRETRLGKQRQHIKRPRAKTAVTSRICFAQLAELHTGTVFGLDTLTSSNCLETSLISEGAECIFVSKKFFLREANVKVMRVMADMVQGYPKQDTVVSQVHRYRKWKRYKKDVVREILARDRMKARIFVGGIPVFK
ncbi:hypothetical protein ScPMuIL_010079 [Solemya velum]